MNGRIRATPQMAKVDEDDYFLIKYFMKGSAHLTFRKPELVGKMNDIIAKHYLNTASQGY
ncbi:z1226 protein [Yersinia intermedia]|nr:z1226 protein [Yersinia intermedia]